MISVRETTMMEMIILKVIMMLKPLIVLILITTGLAVMLTVEKAMKILPKMQPKTVASLLMVLEMELGSVINNGLVHNHFNSASVSKTFGSILFEKTQDA